MHRLTYGSFEETLRTYIQPKITMLDLGNILLISPITGAVETDSDKNRELVRNTYSVDNATVTRIRSGERGLSPRLLSHYADPNALAYIKRSFELDITPRIHSGSKEALLQDVLSLIEQDDVLTQKEKTYLCNLATADNLCDFLAETYMYAINRKPAVQKIENLPRQNHWFCGRKDLLDMIDRNYRSENRIQGLFGMGGVGKTQLALQYAHLHAEDYETIWWINAENKLSLQNSISKFLSVLKIRPKGSTTDGIRLAFLKYCAKHSGWLFVYDNAEYGTNEEYQTLLEYFPEAPLKGDVLLTTRCKNPFENAIHTEIQVYSQEEAAAFLQRRSRLDDGPNAERVAIQLGFLPLALEYAAAYIRETPGVDYVSYSEKLERHGIKVLDRRVGQQSYKNTVREAFHITLDRLLEDSAVNPLSKGAEQFLYICAFLASDGIELGIFSEFGKGLPDPIKTVLDNELDRDELTRNLTRYSLVQIDHNTMSMHRLLQEVLRDELDPTTQMLCINYAYGVYYSAFYSVRCSSSEKISRLLADSVPHVQSILYRYVRRYQDNKQAIPDGIMVAKEYFSWTGMLLIDTKQLEGNELISACGRNIIILRAAKEFYDTMPGRKTIYPAFIALLLAQAYEGLGNTPAAQEQYLEALSISDAAMENLPTASELEHPESVQSQYLKDALQLGADICAAVGSSRIIYGCTELLWQNLTVLRRIIFKQMQYFPRKVDAGAYQTSAAYLRLFACQIADYTHRAFVLRLGAPANWLEEREQVFLDGPFVFFSPSTDSGEVPSDVLDGFDILLENQDRHGVIRLPDKLWETLAFAEDVRTESDMLITLLSVNAVDLSLPAKRTLYSVICILARRLNNGEIMRQYTRKLHDILGGLDPLLESGSNDR